MNFGKTSIKSVRRWPWLCALLAVVMGLPTLRGGFVGNDDKQLVLNHVLVNHPSIEHAIELLRISHRDLYQPVPLLTFSLEFAVAQALGLFDRGIDGGAWLFHLTNVLMHALNAALVFLVVRRLHHWVAPDASNVVAGAAAALFAVHPLQVEAVAWINGRMMLMSTMFALTAALAFSSWVQCGKIRFAIGTIASVTLCMMCKVRVGVPVMLLLAALSASAPEAAGGTLAKVRDGIGGLLRQPRVVGIWAAAGAITGLFVWLNVGVTSQNTELFELAAEHLHGSRLVRVLLAVAWYVAHFIWPAGLASWYPAPAHVAWADSETLRALVVLAAGGVAFVLLQKHRPVTLLATVWFFGTIADTLPIVPARNLLAADRYMYLSILGPCWIAAVMAIEGFRRLTAPVSPQTARFLSVSLSAALIGALLGVSWHLQPFYESSIGKTARIASLYPSQPHVWARLAWAHYHAGTAATSEGRPETAREHFNRAIQFVERELSLANDGGWCEAYQVLGATRLQLGDVEAGLAALRKAVEIAPSEGEPKYRLAIALEDLNRLDEAIDLFEASHRIAPGHNPTTLRLARLYRRLGRPSAARALYEEALLHNRHEVSATLALAELDLEVGSPESLASAESRLRQLLKWMPENTAARVSLGVVLHRTGRIGDAVRQYEHAVSQSPCNVPALVNLAQIHDAAGAGSAAAKLFERAAECGPETAAQAAVVAGYWLSQDRRAQALDVWRRFLAANPESDEALLGAAWTLAVSGALDEAQTLVTRADSPNGDKYMALSVRGYLSLARGHYADAARFTGELCRAGQEAGPARRQLLRGLEIFDNEKPSVPWTLCLAAALLTKEENLSAAEQFWKLCEESCASPECGAFRQEFQLPRGPQASPG